MSGLSNWQDGVAMRCFEDDYGRSRFQYVLGVDGGIENNRK